MKKNVSFICLGQTLALADFNDQHLLAADAA